MHPQNAYQFYRTFILQSSQKKAKVYKTYGFTMQGSVSSKDWEVFAAILLNDRANGTGGADLMHYEVKSAVIGGNFEYQYHRHQGLNKLANDQAVDHVFVTRNEAYTQVEVWLVSQGKLQATFDRWLPELQQNYQTAGRQRFRRSVTYSFVKTQGTLLLTIMAGKLAYAPTSIELADSEYLQQST
nr:hypothetical protein [Alkalinema sp. FACHB-956]